VLVVVVVVQQQTWDIEKDTRAVGARVRWGGR
jgi:hypothetical protein